MFGNFKEKIHNVQHDLTLGWRNLADKAKLVNKKIARKATLLSDSDAVESEDPCFSCNLEAGGDILKKYQLDWIEMHSQSLCNVEKAAEADRIIFELARKCQLAHDTITVLHNELSLLPNLVAQLDVVKSDMASLTTQIDILEEVMIELEDVCEKQEIERRRALHKARLGNLKENVKVEYQEQRGEFLQIRQLAQEKRTNLERQASVERQHIFEDEFLKQMELYNQFGITEKPIVDQHQSEQSLADISIEDDTDMLNELDNFLGPEQAADAPVEEGSDQEASSESGAEEKPVETEHERDHAIEEKSVDIENGRDLATEEKPVETENESNTVNIQVKLGQSAESAVETEPQQPEKESSDPEKETAEKD